MKAAVDRVLKSPTPCLTLGAVFLLCERSVSHAPQAKEKSWATATCPSAEASGSQPWEEAVLGKEALIEVHWSFQITPVLCLHFFFLNLIYQGRTVLEIYCTI